MALDVYIVGHGNGFRDEEVMLPKDFCIKTYTPEGFNIPLADENAILARSGTGDPVEIYETRSEGYLIRNYYLAPLTVAQKEQAEQILLMPTNLIFVGHTPGFTSESRLCSTPNVCRKFWNLGFHHADCTGIINKIRSRYSSGLVNLHMLCCMPHNRNAKSWSPLSPPESRVQDPGGIPMNSSFSSAIFEFKEKFDSADRLEQSMLARSTSAMRALRTAYDALPSEAPLAYHNFDIGLVHKIAVGLQSGSSYPAFFSTLECDDSSWRECFYAWMRENGDPEQNHWADALWFLCHRPGVEGNFLVFDEYLRSGDMIDRLPAEAREAVSKIFLKLENGSEIFNCTDEFDSLKLRLIDHLEVFFTKFLHVFQAVLLNYQSEFSSDIETSIFGSVGSGGSIDEIF
ncbi:putative adhesin [Streptomyces vinaceus]|uniref:putative adhesin n=1 Tax=Streptomyces vinaceus TaxID=1960 RepID=UPI003817705E